jgi:putative endonuclease
MGLARKRGVAGEALAADYLELAGFEVVARNVRMHGVEVDLVVRDGESRVLVEVKCRNRSDYGGAALAVDHVKRQRLLRAALALESEGSASTRIDVVAIELSNEGATVHHYRNAVTE